MPVLSATDQLKAMVQSSVDPTLSDDEITTLLANASVVDSTGLAPTHDDWTATYDLNRAAAAGWRLKAGKAANRFSFGSDVNRFDRKQIHDNCLAMAKEYSRKIGGAVTVPGQLSTALDDPVVGNG